MSKSNVVLAISLLYSTLSFAQVGIGTTSPNSMLDVRGSLSTNYRSFTGTTAIATTDNNIVFTGTTAGSATLPTAVGITGRTYWIKNASITSPTPVLTINTTSSQTIDGNSSWTLNEPNEVIALVSDGANWFITNQSVAIPKTGTTGGPWLQGGNNVASVKTLGTIGNFDLPFITNNTEKMRLTTSGYLGVNTMAPAGRLHLVNENNELGDDYLFDDYGAGTTQGLYMTKSRGTVAAPENLQNGDAIGWLRFIPRYSGSLSYNGGSSIETYYKGDGSNNLTDLRLFTSNAERMRINETGNVAIGAQSWDASNPEKLLVDAGSTSSFNVISGRGSINNYLQLNIQNRSNGTSASSDVVASANNSTETSNFIDMGINSSTYSNTSYPIIGGANNAYLYSTGRDLVIGNASSTRNLIFFTNGFSLSDEKMRISSSGNIGIGTTTAGDKLTVAGNVAPGADNTYSLGKSGLRWTAVWATNGVIQTSDARLKTAIKPLQYGLKQVMEMQPVEYEWKDDSTGEKQIGLIAQEVQKIVPEVVTGNAEKETLGMNYAELVPVLINAIKEQQGQINKIEQRINNLKKRTASAK